VPRFRRFGHDSPNSARPDRDDGRGNRTIVDLTTVDLGRDIGLILDVARRVPVIVATGVWCMPQALRTLRY